MTNQGEYEVLTSLGPAGIAVLRVCGPGTAGFLAQHIRRSHPTQGGRWTAGGIYRAELLDDDGNPVDDMLVSVHADAPTLDVRLHLHGNPWLGRRCTEWLCASGFTPTAQPPTDLWAAPSLLAAEAYALLPHMSTLRGAHWLLGQATRLETAIAALLANDSMEEVRSAAGQIADRFAVVDWFARSLRVVLAGPPNVGKSTLANALADRTVSVVSPTPGTTRDWVEVPSEAHGFPIVWLDTAGLRTSSDPLEQESMQRTRQLVAAADLVVLVLDASADSDSLATSDALWGAQRVACVALNKSDLASNVDAQRASLPEIWRQRAVATSATEATGLDELRGTLLASLGRTDAALDAPAAFTTRQIRLLTDIARSQDRQACHRALAELRGPTAGD